MPAEYDFQSGIVFIGQQDEAVILVFAQVVLLAAACFKAESLDVRIPLLVGIIKDCRPHLVRVIFLQYPYIVFVVVVHIEIAGVELAVVQHYQDLLVALELTEVFSAVVVVEAQDILVEPYFPSAQCGTAALLQGYLMNRVTGKYITHGLTSFDVYLAEIFFKDDAAYARIGLERHFDDFGLTVGIGCEIHDA